MKNIYLSIILPLFISMACEQSNKIDTARMSDIVKQEAMKMASSLVERNANALINFNHPRVIEGIGGKEKFIEVLEKTWKDMDADSSRILSDSIGEPSKIIYHKESFQCSIPQTMIIEMRNKKVSVQSTLIGISYEGEKWYFFDAAGGNLKNIKRNFPEFSDSLLIPDDKAEIIKN